MNSQMIQRLCRKLVKVSAIIESSLEVTTGYELHCKDLTRLGVNGVDPSLVVEVEMHAARLRDHRRSVTALLQRSHGALKMVRNQSNEYYPNEDYKPSYASFCLCHGRLDLARYPWSYSNCGTLFACSTGRYWITAMTKIYTRSLRR